MTLARVRRPTCQARPAARQASPSTYTPPWKYRTTWRGSIPSMVISAVGTPPSAAAVTVTPAGSGCADVSSRSSRRCSLTSMPTGKADCRRIASRFSRCSVLTEDLPSVCGRLGSAPRGSPMPIQLPKFPAGRRATARLAARKVRRRHRITVIRATGAPQNRSTMDRRECAGRGPLLPSPWIALLCVAVRARLGRPAAQRARRAHRAAGPVGAVRRARRDRSARPGPARGPPAHPDRESPEPGDTGSP